ncbi:MAG TPA: chemotaxis protein CheB, partial [Candidatus Acidoferrales bacterium]|nr:chemotaxis protein CheB [Candidatus Acidoferrales bacterium]
MAVKKTQPKAKAKLPEQAPARKPSVEAHATGRNHCPVVGFGASAGGLEAFTELLQHVPKEPGIALVFIQHLDPKHASILTELLARATTLPVMQAADGMHVEANHVYVIPPSRILKISKGLLRLEPREAGLSMPIDSFFRSLAEDLGNRAIGVILSGTASDGTLGLMAIKAEGGITFAQDVQSAKYDGMPRSAIAAGCVDFILPPEQIAREIMALCHHPYVSSAAATAAPEEEPSFKEVFSMLRSATGVDFSYYKPGTIRRRTLRRMALQKIGRMDDYVAYLKENRDELRLLFEDIL